MTPVNPYHHGLDSATLYSKDNASLYDSDEGKYDTTRHLWRQKLDKQQVYAIDRKVQFSDGWNEHVKELTRWRDADIKGNRETYYIN